MFEQAFKRIDDILRKDAGVSTELDYIEQTSWLLFLKYLDALEQDRAARAERDGTPHSFLLDEPYRWHSWAAPMTADGVLTRLDHDRALVGDDLREFIDAKLFPYLKGFKQRASRPDTIEYKIGEIFGELRNKFQSGYNLRVYDGALGSAGFLCEAYARMLPSAATIATRARLQSGTFYGQEKKPLPYVIGLMNMILHGIEAPNIVHTNTLEFNNNDIEERDRHDIILANPPFGGRERAEVQQNFAIKTSETAFLFLQHFLRKLRAGGRAAIVIKNTFLSNTDNASVALRKLLLEDAELHTILDCPGGTFQGAGVKTVVLFFTKGAATKKTWYYRLDPGRNLGKTNPLNDADLVDFVEKQKTFADSAQSWTISASDLDRKSWDLSVKNPNGGEAAAHRTPEEILDEIEALDRESAEILAGIRGLL